MDAVAKMKDPVTAGEIPGHQDVCTIVRVRDQVMPEGLRLDVTLEPGPALERPVRKTTAWAAPLMRAFEAPAGVQVMVRFETDDRWGGVVQAGRARHVRCASTLKSHRRLVNASWQLTAGGYGRHLFRRRHTATLVRAQPYGQARDRFVDAGGRGVPLARGLSSSRAKGPHRLASDWSRTMRNARPLA